MKIIMWSDIALLNRLKSQLDLVSFVNLDISNNFN